MMKKLISTILATVMVFGMATSVFASEPTPMQPTDTESVYEGQDFGNGANLEVPVDGQINRKIPVIKITADIGSVYWWVPSEDGQGSVWENGTGYNDIANQTDGIEDGIGVSSTTAGTVYSPTYSITNESGFDVAAALYSFETESTSAEVTDLLNLKLVWNNSLVDTWLVDSNTDAGDLSASPVELSNIANDQTVEFSFTGQWIGTYQSSELSYGQKMVLNFKKKILT